MCKISNVVSIGRALAFVLSVFVSSANAEWSTYQSDAAHTGYVSGTLDLSGFGELWNTQIAPSGALSDLAVSNNTVFVSRSYYFGGSVSSFFAVNSQDGSISWSKGFGNIFSTNPPAYANGIVYLQTGNHSGDTWLHAFDETTGNYVFKSPFSAQWERYLSPTVYGDNVYIDGGYYGGMYSFDAATGNQNWFGSVPQYDGWTPAVDDEFCYSFTGSGSTSPVRGVFRMINRETGATHATVIDNGYSWNGYTMDAAVTLGNDQAFATNGGRLLAFDTTEPSIDWVLSGGYIGQPSLANGVLYINRNGGVSAINPESGDVLWSWYLSDSSLTNAPFIVTDNVLFASTDSRIYAIDLATHQDVWNYPVSGRMALSNGVLYVAGSNGALTAIGVPVPEPVSAGLGILAAVGIVLVLPHDLRRRRGRRR